MVVSAHPEASRIGLEILQKGGNAYDAAVATGFALAVAYPVAGNIGGGGFLVYRKQDGEIGTLDYREKAPKAATKNMYLDAQGNVVADASTLGHLAVGVPGAVAGLVAMHQKLGSLPWAQVVQPAIDLAQKGVVLTEREARMLNGAKEGFIKANKFNTHVVRETPWEKGDILPLQELARTLERIRDKGRNGFYEGETADLLVKEMRRGGGIITHQDLKEYQSVWRPALTGTYRGYKVISMPPPSSGGIALLQLLQMVEPYDLQKWGWQHANTVHVMVEAQRRVYADRATYLGDPDFFKVPVANLLNPAYLKNRMATLNMEQATPSTQVQQGRLLARESDQTTHYSIVDQWGNAASVTTTLNGGYGSKVVVEGAGFILNNEMDDFSVKPGVPNMFGLIGGEANAIAPGKRMLSSMTPTILEKDGKLFMVVGTPGGSTIITSVFQTILNVIDHDMGMQKAVSAPRFHHQWLPDRIEPESDALSASVRAELQKRGHLLQNRSSYGAVEGILKLKNGTWEGGADPRGDDTAMGY
ncbi:gamma-glutamyltranspeptidase [Rufibacter tibetensis]|uniref:Glutathione hydrolase proenzyme n=2 Tax=Rufibacter tibetensis TaxID=512763 RepID=A0A0P0CUL9_9BACT|nr:gamma-glutamyltransferase [Rufibacter tibetensis]ALI98054.1 gamma-glutamyltranspeptidase [Rufibacter tibetensis]